MCKSNECKVISCKGRVVNKEYCRKHLKALLDGTLECKVSDCNREMLYDGYCGKHHMQWRRYDRVFTDLEFKEIKPNLFCNSRRMYKQTPLRRILRRAWVYYIR
ncbi:Cysteine-rich protein [Bacillus thuringiensis serovar israelensis ATCC 35646]|nr:Cysteine-rich protein [Bacillus thuringiensis serovar israelensis ATCC 35646]